MYQNFENIDHAIGEALAEDRLNSIDIDYITEQIDDQINNLLSSGSKKNFLKSFERQLEDASRLQTEGDTNSIRESMYNLIIQNISDRFDMDVDLENVDVRKAAKHFYKFFVLNYTDNLSYFIKSYIVENKDDIVNSLKHMDHVNAKKIQEINPDISIIVNNMSDVINIINSKNIDFSEFLDYLGRHPESSSSVEEMKEYLNDAIEDADSVVEKLMEPLVNEEENFGEIYVNVQMDLYSDFNEEDDE